jgi:hypothetical protein
VSFLENTRPIGLHYTYTIHKRKEEERKKKENGKKA